VEAVAQAVNRAGLYRLLTKPWLESDLTLTVKEALRRVQQERQIAQHAQALEQSLQLLHATMDATLDGLLALDGDGTPVHMNAQLVDLWRVPQQLAHVRAGGALLDALRRQVLPPCTLELDAGRGPAVPTVVELTDGRLVEYLSRAYVLQGRRGGTVFSFRDVTVRERSAQRLRHQALHDSLSGLPNRLQFNEALDRAVRASRATGSGLAVMFIDLDDFKRINDSLGHDFGDQLLKRVADRLSGCMRHGDLIARWGGDEFTVLATNLRDAQESAVLASRIVEVLEQPFLVGEETVQVSGSVGVASYPNDGEDGAALLQRADMALYRAKEEGRNGFQFFRHSEFAELGGSGGMALETELRAAIRHGELQLHYQMQFDAASGRVTGVEALARWPHSRHGWIAPGVFIPMAERTGAIVALGEWALETACRQAASWRALGLDFGRIGVNLSALQFTRGDLPGTVRRVLADSGLDPAMLELEVTEAVALRHVGAAAETLRTLRQMGVQVALDDFGTGFASLTYLRQLPCDTLKIDRSFTSELEHGGKDAEIVRALTQLADGLHLRIVAEGVETRHVADLLQGLGCRVMQGYLFARPLPAADATALLQAARDAVR
jgi:diguanylate cyclase (GGDEF)-like protein